MVKIIKGEVIENSEEVVKIMTKDGSVWNYSKDEIKEVAREYGFTVGNFQRRPIEGLVDYHAQIART